MICNNCAIINGTQLDALTCSGKIGQVMCEDRTFYYCWLSQRWERIPQGKCDNIDHVVIEDYEIDFSVYMRCCK
jgi:hypothetical protein